MLGDREKIKQYLRDLQADILGVRNTDSVEIMEMTPGSYNLNFHVRVDQKEFIFRINIEQQSGLSNQIEYEFRVLKFLETHHKAPNAYYFDDSLERFDFGILIEEYLEGPHLSLEKEDVLDVAGLLAGLHSLELEDQPFITWKDPLADTYELVRNDLINYEAKSTPTKKIISLSKKLLSKAEVMIPEHRHLFHADSLNHTDVVCDNFIKTPDGLRMIDWEKPRIDDCSYDIGCFLSEPAEMWCSHKILNSNERLDFLNTYARLSGKEAYHLIEKVKIREPLISLHWILWGATKLCDIRERLSFPELMEAHQEKTARYERIANPENIEKLLEAWSV